MKRAHRSSRSPSAPSTEPAPEATPTPDAEPQLRVADNPEERRYEAWLGDRLVGTAEYRVRGSRVLFFHTVVEPALEGHGVGSGLARTALDDVRAKGLQVIPRCPFIAAWIRRHPAYADLVSDPEPDGA